MKRRFIAISLACLASTELSAQTTDVRVPRTKLLAANVLIGAFTGSAVQILQHKPYWRGMLKGAIGGATVFAGKCLIAQRTSTTDWLGRGVTAVGSSITANAATGRSPLQKLALPIGPLEFDWDRKSRQRHVRVNLPAVVAATYFATRPHSSFDAMQSLAHGGLVFENPSTEFDVQAAGVIRLRPGIEPSLVAHEMTHVAQNTFVSIGAEEPLEAWLLEQIPAGRKIHAMIELGILSPVWAALNKQTPVYNRPWEREARSFEEGC